MKVRKYTAVAVVAFAGAVMVAPAVHTPVVMAQDGEGEAPPTGDEFDGYETYQEGDEDFEPEFESEVPILEEEEEEIAPEDRDFDSVRMYPFELSEDFITWGEGFIEGKRDILDEYEDVLGEEHDLALNGFRLALSATERQLGNLSEAQRLEWAARQRTFVDMVEDLFSLQESLDRRVEEVRQARGD